VTSSPPGRDDAFVQKWEMASELLCITHKNVNDLARGRLGTVPH